jgi:small-conductance mechanosensitive channel
VVVHVIAMNHDLSTNDQLGTFASAVTNVLQGWTERIVGPSVGNPVFGSVTWGDLCVAAVFLVLTLVLSALVAFVLWRRTEASKTQVEDEAFRKDSIAVIGKPTYLLVWIYGVYLASTPFLLRMGEGQDWRIVLNFVDKLLDAAVFAVLLWLFFRFTHVLESWIKKWFSKTASKLDDLLAPLLGKSLRIIVPVLGIIFALPLLGLPEHYASVVAKGTSILIIVGVALILWQLVGLGEKAVMAEYDINVADNLRARKAYTQVHVISKTLYFAITIFTLASVLMLFKEVQRFGTSILASAGVVGIIIGFAAQKTISNLFAGFQLAMTQPIRLDDVVIVEGEWGRIEEITLTYVVVSIWDERRLVVPLSNFIEKPFQNWTRKSADLLGTVFVWVDYSMPLEEVRKALKEIIETDPLWDKRFWNLQVTEATERTMQIRVLATSADSSKSWDLRCKIREKLIEYLQKHHPESLPKLRTDIGSPPPWKSGKDAPFAPRLPAAESASSGTGR